MTDLTPEQKETARRMQAMYNAHPFPHYYAPASPEDDQRKQVIFGEYLRLPLEQLSTGTILDAGCGTGENTWQWRRLLAPEANVIAVDLSFSSCGIAHHRFPDAPMQPDFFNGSLLDLGLESESMDLVFCSGVLHHIPNRERAYQELLRVLKPGGYLVLILYHRYGRAIHGLRRSIVNFLAGEDVDRRAITGGKLFGRRFRRIAEEKNSPFENVLYDQFGAIESRHSFGEVLRLFADTGIEYTGAWPPVEWSQFGKAIRFSRILKPYRQTSLYRAMLRLFPDQQPSPDEPPGWWARTSMQAFWALQQLQLFAISGRKRDT